MKNLTGLIPRGGSLGVVAASLVILFGFGRAWAAGPTFVQKNITKSVEWTAENSPYVIQNDITVATGTILTIDPGVEVHFTGSASEKAGKGPNLFIKGGLKAMGNDKTPISFVPSVEGNQWGSISFLNCDSSNSSLTRCRIVGGRVFCEGSSPTISSCAIGRGTTGIEISANSQPHILGNWIKANRYGLVLSADTASPIVQRNTITGNQYGVYLKNFQSPTITHNRIFDNLKYNVVNNTAKGLEMPNNDFNSADRVVIAKGIYDGANNPALGRLNVAPFTVAAGSTTPAATKASTSSSTAAQPAAVQSASKARAERYDQQFSLSLDVMGMGLLSCPYNYLTPAFGVGGQVFLDWRPIQPLSLGFGGQYSYFFGTSTFNLDTFDLGGRIFPFPSDTTPDGEFYLQGGVGLNLLVQFPAIGHYHGYAGIGYRKFIGTDQALDMGAQYDFYSPIAATSNAVGLKVGWTFLFNTK